MEDNSNNNINLEIVEKESEEKPKENPNYDVVRYTDKRGYCYRIKYRVKIK